MTNKANNTMSPNKIIINKIIINKIIINKIIINKIKIDIKNPMNTPIISKSLDKIP